MALLPHGCRTLETVKWARSFLSHRKMRTKCEDPPEGLSTSLAQDKCSITSAVMVMVMTKQGEEEETISIELSKSISRMGPNF